MGSLRLIVDGRPHSKRKFDTCAAELHFADVDGVAVVASLYLDSEGLPLELDIWKTDFSPLNTIPNDFDN
jgi:hypothetical protein